MYLTIIGLLYVGFDNCLKSKLTIILSYFSCMPDSPTQRGRKSLVKAVLASCTTGMFSIQQWWHSVYRVNPCYKTNTGNKTAQLCVWYVCVLWTGVQTVDHKNMTVGQHTVHPNMVMQ